MPRPETVGAPVRDARVEPLPDLCHDLDEAGVLQRLGALACAATGAVRARTEVLDHCGAVLRAVDDHGRLRSKPLPDGPTLCDEVVLDGRVVARLTLVGEPAREFDAAHSARLAELVRHAAPALRNARRHRAGERRREAAEVLLELERASSTGAPLDELLHTVTGAARRVLAATGVAVLQPHPSGLHRVRALTVSRGSRTRLRTLFDLARSHLEELVVTGEELHLEVEGEMFLFTPVESVHVERHFLGVWFSGGRTFPLDEDEGALLELFVEQAGVTLSRAQLAQERERAAVRAERDRIARDLHDVAIQRIFAAGLHLKALVRHDDLEQVHRGLESVATDLDLTIGDIRSAIFELTHSRGARLRDEIRLLAAEYSRTIGFNPWVFIEGDLDGVELATGQHLLATLRELLSNVARHADADTCRVEVVHSRGWLTLAVSDDGRSIDLQSPRSGLENLRVRASLLGGTISIEQGRPAGTVVTWRVPLVTPDALPEEGGDVAGDGRVNPA